MDEAAKLVQVGDTALDKEVPIEEMAALMQVVHTVYNMEEAIVKT